MTISSSDDFPKTIAVVGASARAAAFSVKRAWRSAITADLFADADLRQHCPTTVVATYPEGLADWLASTEVDAWLYTGALENYPTLIDQLAEIRPLLGNSGEPLRRCRDPFHLQKVFNSSGLLFPETRSSSIDLPLDGSWLCKTYRGSSGSGVWELVDQESQKKAIDQKACFQKRIEGQPASAVFALGERSTTLLGLTAQWIGPTETGPAKFQYVGSYGIGHAVSSKIQSQLKTLAQVLANQFQLRGLVGVDLLLDSDNAWIVEINPRYTASVEIIERETGLSAIEAHLAACTGATFDATNANTSKLQHGKAIIYAKREATIDADFFNWAIAQAGYQLDSRLADIPEFDSIIPAGRPVLTVFAAAPASQIKQKLNQRIAEVESRLYRCSS